MISSTWYQKLTAKNLIIVFCLIFGVWWIATYQAEYRKYQVQSNKVALKYLPEQVIAEIRCNISKPVVIPELNITCKAYEEFRNINFQDPGFRKFLCRDAEAFVPQANGQFPVCLLSDSPIMRELIRLTSAETRLTYVQHAHGLRIPIYTYGPQEAYSKIIISSHQWENPYVVRIVSMALKIPDTTFLDIGSNLGVYSIYATAKNLPTVSFDANIRNLIRLHRTMKKNGIKEEKSKIIWNYFSKSSEPQHLVLIGHICTYGSNLVGNKVVHDNVPIMPISGNALIPFVKSRNIVMKVDIEGGEASFFLSSLKLFDTFNVAVVQMESYFAVKDPKKAKVFEDFFVKRKFLPFKFSSLRNVPVKNWTKTGEWDIIWIRNDFVGKLGLEIKFP